MPDYGLREDGTPKGLGFFGELKRPDGSISTELSAGFNFDGKETLAPLLVPTLSKEEIDILLSGAKPTESIYNKAANHALERMRLKKSVWADQNEIYKVPNDIGTLGDVITK